MEHINKIELQGTIGTIRTMEISDEMVANMSVATEYIYKNKAGDAIVETTWHMVVVWGNTTKTDLTRLEKGMKVHIVGRVRQTKYIGSDGLEKTFQEVIAHEFEIIKN